MDGDTVKVELDDGAPATVRLIGIDTPESVKPGTPVECQAQEATENLSALVEGEAVNLTIDPTQDREDRFGRLLAYVDRTGRDVGEAQIRAGFSRVYIYDNRPFQRLSAYQAAEEEAAAAERGAWKACEGNFHTPDGDDFAVQQDSCAESAERFVRRYYSLLNQRASKEPPIGGRTSGVGS